MSLIYYVIETCNILIDAASEFNRASFINRAHSCLARSYCYERYEFRSNVLRLLDNLEFPSTVSAMDTIVILFQRRQMTLIWPSSRVCACLLIFKMAVPKSGSTLWNCMTQT